MKPGARPPYTTAKPASNLQRPAPLPTQGLRNFLIILWVLIGGFAAYAYSQNPAGCTKVVDDARDVVVSLLPARIGEPRNAPIVGASIGSTTAAPVAAPPATAATAPSKPTTLNSLVSAITSSASTPSPESAPASSPDAIPARPHWTWTTLDGKTYEDVVINKMEPDVISITHSKGVSHLPMSLLSDDVKKQLHYDPAAAAAAAGQVTKLIEGKLVDANGTPVKAPGPEVQYYAIYYSAAWCPPCHAFTPKLVAWYNKFKPTHSNFEVIFVSDDRSQEAMFGYMREMKMPWLAINFSDVTHDQTGISKFANSGIPDLVLVDADGKVLADSFQGSTYLGPETVVDQINKLVGGSSPVPL